MPNQTKPIAITIGDIAGISPEIIIKAYGHGKEQEKNLLKNTFVAGDIGAIKRGAKIAGMSEKQIEKQIIQIQNPADALEIKENQIPVYQIGEPVDLEKAPLGQISQTAGKLAAESVIWAANAALKKEISAIVTAPLNKEAMHSAGQQYKQFAGHTEILQYQTAKYLNQSLENTPVRMMLANDELRVVLLSIHVSLQKAIENVSECNIIKTLEITHKSVGTLLQKTPKIAVAGLNPHAGENGLMGDSEIKIINPAIKKAQKMGINASGAYSPDTIFMRAKNKEFDVVLAMYHDQGLIPIKYLGIDNGVNITLGLPIIRTSPDHGTAFDIAGQNKANSESLISAIKMAKQMIK